MYRLSQMTTCITTMVALLLIVPSVSLAQQRPSPSPSVSPSKPNCNVCRCTYSAQTRTYRILKELKDGTPIRGSLLSLQKTSSISGSTYARNCAALASNNGRVIYERGYHTDYEAQEVCSSERTINDKYCSGELRIAFNKPCSCKVTAAVSSNSSPTTTSSTETFQTSGTVDRCSDLNHYYIDETTWYPHPGPTPSAGGYLGVATETSCK
jgi:hypothetical protein